MSRESSKNSISIKRIRVRRGTVDLDVVTRLDALHVTQEQAGRVLGLLPNLAHHVCVNGAGDGTFGDELVGTELAHLLEHVIIELQGKAYAGAHQFTGHTSWLDELNQTAPQGMALMRTSVTFQNDFVALAATKYATEIINWLVEPDVHPQPNIEEIISQLQSI